jgi:sulfatase modifying factor 1
MLKCEGDCVDEGTDPNNCGGCGVVCPSGTCQNGTCVPITDAIADANGDGTEAGTDAGAPPSCAPGGPGMTNCGPGGSGTESCCTSLEVTGGTFNRSYDEAIDDAGNIDLVFGADGGPADEADPATVSSFRLDKYLVTVGRFRQFVNAWNDGNGYTPPAGSGKHAHLNGGLGLVNVGADDAGVTYEPGWVSSDDSRIAPTNADLTTACFSPPYTWTPSAGSTDTLPINCVNWYEAYAFCIWDGGFLPSEAEWEYAAAGGSQQREYPWGSTDPGMANQYAIYFEYFRRGAQAAPAPVGFASLGAGLWGQLDLVGNLSEWNLDWSAIYGDPCVDCAILTPPILSQSPNERVVSAGDYLAHIEMLSNWNHEGTFPSDRLTGDGFRCARTP